MADKSILIICGANGLSADADERLRQQAEEAHLLIKVEMAASHADWPRIISRYHDSCAAMILTPGPDLAADSNDREALYRALSDASQKGILLAEVHEDNIFRGDTGIHPLQPSGCHIRLVCGLGAAGLLLAVDAMAGAGTRQ